MRKEWDVKRKVMGREGVKYVRDTKGERQVNEEGMGCERKDKLEG